MRHPEHILIEELGKWEKLQKLRATLVHKYQIEELMTVWPISFVFPPHRLHNINNNNNNPGRDDQNVAGAFQLTYLVFISRILHILSQ